MTSIIIPEGVMNIGWYAFDKALNLVIYTIVLTVQAGWKNDWNILNRPVYWVGEWQVDSNGSPIPNS